MPSKTQAHLCVIQARVCSILLQDADENKLIYTDIFQEYQAVVERSLEQRLAAAIPNFSMDTFIEVGTCPTAVESHQLTFKIVHLQS